MMSAEKNARAGKGGQEVIFQNGKILKKLYKHRKEGRVPPSRETLPLCYVKA